MGGAPGPDRHASRRVRAGRGRCAERGRRRAGPAAAESRLARLFGPPAPSPAQIDPMVVETRADVARRRASPNAVAGQGHRRLHGAPCRATDFACDFAPTRGDRDHAQSDEPDLDCGRGSAAAFFLSSRPLMQTIGALLFLAHSILDGCDGELARLKFQQSRWGGILDFWGDNVVHTVIFACMGVGWSLAAGSIWPLALGAAAVFGTLGSAGFVYRRVMRGKDGADTLFTSVSDAPGPAADAASRFRLAPRFHLSRNPAGAVRPVELVPGPGGDRRAGLFSAGAFCRAAASLPGSGWLRGRAGANAALVLSRLSRQAIAARGAAPRPGWARHSSTADAVRAQPMVQCVLQVFGASNCPRRSA